MNDIKYLRGKSDFFVGRRGQLDRYLICSMEGYFPVLVRTGDQSLAVVFRTGATHVGLCATVAVSTSADGGKSWSTPVEALPRWEDYRNPAFGVNSQGELILACCRAALEYTEKEPGDGLTFDLDFMKKPEVRERIEREAALFIVKSGDNGKTWSEAQQYRSGLLSGISPHGRIITAPDGTLLMPAYGTLREKPDSGSTCILIRSADGGKTWGDETIAAEGYSETNYAFNADGTLVAASRSDRGDVGVFRSDDLGRTWSKPETVTRVMEHPGDLTLLQSGRMLLTFGRRIRPMGCGLLLSDDGGRTWRSDREVLLAGDGVNVDVGYPSSVQLQDGKIVTAVYFCGGTVMSKFEQDWGYVSVQAIHYSEEDIK